MIARGGYPRTAMNFSNQGVLRSVYQGPKGQGFYVSFLGEKARIRLDEALLEGVIATREASLEALVAETDETKQLMRSFLDGHFTKSAMHGNNHRRVSNAAVQSVYYDDSEKKGQYTSLIYSKFGIGKGKTFQDFLLLHMRGGELKSKTGDWLVIPNAEERGKIGAAPRGPMQIGRYELSDSDIFFRKSKDGTKLFQLRAYRKSHKIVLLATLVKSLRIEPSLQGLEAILASRGARFESNFDAAFSRKKAEGRFVQ